MNKEEILEAIEQLSEEDRQAVRTKILEGAGGSCCGGDEMKQHMESMMKMMGSSENPMEGCKQMMEMCQQMMRHKEAQPT